MNVKPKCPSCGSEEISSADVICATASITAWAIVNGRLNADYSGNTEVHWDTQTAIDDTLPWRCDNCDRGLCYSDLVKTLPAEEQAMLVAAKLEK